MNSEKIGKLISRLRKEKGITLPVSLLTLGFFSLLVNALVLMMAFSLSSGAYIGSFFSAVIASVCLALVNGLVEDLLKDD